MSPVRLRNSKPAAGKADKRAALAARRNGTFFAAELDCFSREKHSDVTLRAFFCPCGKDR